MRIGLLTEGGYPYVTGEARLWCDRLVRGLDQHEFDLFALARSAEQEESGWIDLPPQVRRVRTAPLWCDEPAAGLAVPYGRRERRRFAGHFADLAAAVCTDGDAQADRFGSALYGLAELARDEGGLAAALRSETAVRALERACRAPGARQAALHARVPDLLAVTGLLERALRPLSLDWYDEEPDAADDPDGGGLGAVDLCHAASGGAAALPGLLARHFFGVPLLVTEYGVQLRAHYLGSPPETLSAPARALLAAFHGRLAAEVYRRAALITPGNTHARRWQEKCGADRAKLRTVYPGMAAGRFAEVGEPGETGEPGGLCDPDTLVWVGRIEPAKDLIALLHAFARVRREEPGARLRIVGAPARGPEGAAYLAHCRALAAQLFPDEADDPHAVGDNPVSFEEIGTPQMPELADAYGAGSVVVLSSVVEGFPISLVEAMFCGRATVSTDVGAVVEVIGGTGLVVPPRNPRALADACVALLRDPERRERLGAAARARALELFTVEQNVAAFRGIYLEIVSHWPVRRDAVDETGDPLPFAHPAESHVPGRWAAARGHSAAGPRFGQWLAGRDSGGDGPSWAASGERAGVSEAPGPSGPSARSARSGASERAVPPLWRGSSERPVVAEHPVLAERPASAERPVVAERDGAVAVGAGAAAGAVTGPGAGPVAGARAGGGDGSGSVSRTCGEGEA